MKKFCENKIMWIQIHLDQSRPKVFADEVEVREEEGEGEREIESV